jgi:uncharacterized surface protein with fasciclin (FAS1) repeats
MKRSLQHFIVALFATGLFLGITGCSKQQDRYLPPPWLGGSSIETLEGKGNYKIFLRLMEMAEYKEPISKQLFTLFVPNDSSFTAYFDSVGVASVEDLNKDQAKQLFTLHVLRNPRSRFQLIYEYAWSELQGPTGEYASLFHRKATPSTAIPYEETIKYLPGREGEKILIYTGEKFVPLFTTDWFDDYGGTVDGSDYLFMYPGSRWGGNIQWHNAMVTESEVRTASGFIYFLDRVVPPMPNIEEYLRANPDKYSVYYDMMQRFATYGNQTIDKQKRVLFRKGYDLLFNLAEERGPSMATAVPPQNMWTAYIPNNTVLQNYLDNTVLKFYPSLDSVPRVTLYYILQTQLSAQVGLISKIEKGYFNSFGDAMEISRGDIIDAQMCSNGLVYETNRVLEPNVFTCVPGALFIDRNYSTMLFALNAVNMLTSLSNPLSDVTLFASTNEQLEKYGIRYNATSATIESRGPVDGKWGPMNTTELAVFAQDQIYSGRLSDFSGEGGYVEMNSGNYIHYGNGQVYAGENMFFGNIATVGEVVPNDRNGFLVKVDNPIESRILMGKYLLSDPDISDFVQLLVDARLLDAKVKDPITKEVVPNLKFLAVSKLWTAFIPTNSAMAQARAMGLVPAKASADSLLSFLQYHFIKNKVIFDDGNPDGTGTFDTNRTYKDPLDPTKTLNSPLLVTNTLNNLSVQDVSGKVVNLDHSSANVLVRKGVVHKINSVLKYW